MSNIKMLDPKTMKIFDSSMWETQQDFLNISKGGGSINGGQDSNTQTAQLVRRYSPWASKATRMTAIALSKLPFDILDENGEVVDSSSDWKNITGGMANPETLLYKIASSLCYGKAYIIPTYINDLIVDLRYCAPNTVVPHITTEGLQYFNRSTNQGKTGLYKPADPNNENANGFQGEMMYFWLPDSDVECGPAQAYPAGEALQAVELLGAMDSTIKLLSERGFITPTILIASGNPGPEARMQIEGDWSRFIRGFTNFVAKVFNGDKLAAQKVGAELGEIAAAYPPLSKQAIENIGTAYGIPAALFMSDMAYASEVGPMVKMWYSTSIFQLIYSTIEDTFNSQLLARWGYRMKFKPESLDAFQAEEADRSGAWATYVSNGADPVAAAKMLGIEIPDGLTFEEVFPKKEPAPVPAQLAPFAGVSNPPAAPVQETVPEGDTEDAPEDMPMNAETIKALDLWRQVAVRKFKKHQALPIDFVTDLPIGITESIRDALKSATTEGEVLAAFEIKARPVVDQIKRAVDWLETHHLQAEAKD